MLVRDVLWYAVNKHDLVRLVVVRDPTGAEPDDFFFTTDLAATSAEVASRYAGRWSIEVTFRDSKQDLGGEDPQCWKRQAPERAAALSLWLHALIWCWYLDTHPRPRHLADQAVVPPKDHSQLPRRPRRAPSPAVVATNYTTVIPDTRQHQITDTLLDALAYAA